jgi:flagellar hook-associated protein 1 FlgK
VSAGDAIRSTRLNQLQDVFAGGANGLGAAINDMMNAFSDVVTAPTTCRRATWCSHASTRPQAACTAAERLDEIQATVRYELDGAINDINTLPKAWLR